MALSLAITVLVLAIGSVSSKLSPTKVNSLLLSNETEKYSFNFKFESNSYLYRPDTSPIYLALLDQNGLSPLQKEEADMLKELGRLDYVIADFSRTVSIDFLFSVGTTFPPNSLQPVDRLARVLVVPGSIHQLEEDEEDRKLNESSKDPRSTHTFCIWFNQFKVNESKTNSILDYARASSENLHCLSLTNDSNLTLNFDYQGSLGDFKKSIQLFWNPKKIATYKLSMKLTNVRSLEELTRFVQVELKNPKAKIVEHHQGDPCASSGAWYYYQKLFPRSLKSCNQTEDKVIFESELSFSNETKQFRSEVCKPEEWKEKHGLFTVKAMEPHYHLHSLLYMHPYYSLYYCSTIQIETKVRINFPVDTEFSLSHVDPVRYQEFFKVFVPIRIGTKWVKIVYRPAIDPPFLTGVPSISKTLIRMVEDLHRFGMSTLPKSENALSSS